MLINFLQFLASLIIAQALLRTVQVKLLENNEDSAVGKALAYIS